MFDTHCHLQFKSFAGNEKKIVKAAKEAGVDYIVVPGTDVETSKKAIEIAKLLNSQTAKKSSSTVKQFNSLAVYAAVGIHPHHVFAVQQSESESAVQISSRDQLPLDKTRGQTTDSQRNLTDSLQVEKNLDSSLTSIEELLGDENVVAVGEIGVDRFYYKKTKYSDYEVTDKFIGLQKEFLKKQIELAKKHGKSLILHNRDAKDDLLAVLNEVWDKKLEGKAVFHCCEPEKELLDFAKEHKIYIGVDGDITYFPEKEKFIEEVPLEMLVLETDSPFLTPEPLRSQTPRPLNEPKNLPLIAEFIARIKSVPVEKLASQTEENAKKLFNLR